MTGRELIIELMKRNEDLDKEITLSIRTVYRGKPCNMSANVDSVSDNFIGGIDNQFDELMELGDEMA